MGILIKVSGNPFMIAAFYASPDEQFQAGMFVTLISTNLVLCVRQVRKVFTQSDKVCMVDLW